MVNKKKIAIFAVVGAVAGMAGYQIGKCVKNKKEARKFEKLNEQYISHKQGFYEKYIKRPLDILCSGCALIILSPIFLVVMILVRINLGKPVFFKQQRPGKDGRIFEMIKFRTMKDAVEVATGRKLSDEDRLAIIKDQGESAVTSDAERLTKLGRMMRKFSLDELPELLNILKGDMSIVGPRPLAVIYLPYYNEEERHRHDVRPGLTGLAQINGRNAISWKKRFEYDIDYVKHITFIQDVYIIWRTIAVVFEHVDIAQGEKKPVAFHLERQREWDEKKANNKMEEIR